MIYSSLPFLDYALLPGEHFTTLKHLDKSPLHYHRARTHDRADTPSLRMGRAVHSLVLTPDAADVAVWVGGRRAGKEWEAFQLQWAGCTIVKPEEIATARRMREAVMAHPKARALLESGDPEVSITWTSTNGLACKARVDFVPAGDRGIVELKTTRHIDKRAFQREFASRLYHAQASFYQDGYGLAVFGELAPVRVTMIAVENVEPHDVMVWSIPDDVLEVGRRKVDEWLSTVAACEASGKWPGVGGDGEETMTLPDWAATDGLPDVDMGEEGQEHGER